MKARTITIAAIAASAAIVAVPVASLAATSDLATTVPASNQLPATDHMAGVKVDTVDPTGCTVVSKTDTQETLSCSRIMWSVTAYQVNIAMPSDKYRVTVTPTQQSNPIKWFQLKTSGLPVNVGVVQPANTMTADGSSVPDAAANGWRVGLESDWSVFDGTATVTVSYTG